MSGNSSHGGAREGAGRKPKYDNLGATDALRVPKVLKGDVERMLHLIDSLVAQGFTVEQIEALLMDTLKK